jgi:hypothetical protein
MQMREWAIGQALEARNVALNAIRNKDLDPVERQMAISNAQQSISKIAAKTNDFKQWIAQFADTQPEDLSKLNSPELMKKVNDIYSGKFKVDGNQFVFEDGTVKDFNSLINTRHISRRSDAYASQLKALDEKYRKRALLGYDEAAFETDIKAELENIKYTDADLASIAVDELGLDESEIKAIQDDFEDNGILDDIDKQALITKIKDKYKTATTTIYNNARRLYKEKTKPKPSKPEGASYTKSLQQEINLFGPTLGAYSNYANSLASVKNIQGPTQRLGIDKPTDIPVGNEQKAKLILEQLKTINTTTQDKYATREEQLDIFKSNAQASSELKNKSDEELTALFDALNKDALIFYDGSPVNIDYNDSTEIYRLMLQNTPGLSEEAVQYFMNKHLEGKYSQYAKK